VSIGIPSCATLSKRRCRSWRTSFKAWSTVFGTASDNVKVAKVTVYAVRAKTKHSRKKTVSARAKFFGASTWKAILKGLTSGKWVFTAVAVDTSGNTRTTKADKVTLAH
jgi:hypothetical protein